MNLPAQYKTKKYLLYELIGAAIVLVLLIVRLSKGYVRFHMITDTLWLLSALLLVLPELTKEKPLFKIPGWLARPTTGMLLCLYVSLYHLFITVFRLRNITLEVILYAAAAILFGLALFARSNESGIAIKKFEWKNLLRYPHWPLTIGTTLCMLAPFLKMTKMSSLRSMYGLQFGYDAYAGWGYNNWGYNYYSVNILIKGHLAYWGHFACLLLAFMLVFHAVRAAGNKTYPALDTFFKVSIPVIVAWWILGAKGHTALKGFGNILFIAGILFTATAVYLPDKLGELVKKKGLIQ